MAIIVDLFVIVLGLILGSFYNVVAIRLLKKESFVYPPSHCPQCMHTLSPLDLIPILSYIFLRGKCRYCKGCITSIYPIGESLTAIFFYAIYKTIGFQVEFIPAFILVTVLVLAVLTDLREKLILDIITLPAMLILIMIRLLIGEYSFWYYFSGGVLGLVLLFSIAWLSYGGMGGGDVKLYVVIGLVLGPWLTLMSLVFASFLGALIGGILLVSKVVKRKQPIPFAPFISVGTLVAYLYGWTLWGWYVNLW